MWVKSRIPEQAFKQFSKSLSSILLHSQVHSFRVSFYSVNDHLRPVATVARKEVGGHSQEKDPSDVTHI